MKERRIGEAVAVLIIITVVVVGVGAYIVTRPRPNFQVENLSLSSDTVAKGESFSASMNVANVGDAKGTHTVSLEVGDETLKKEITLESGGSQTLSFDIEREEKGTYNLNVGDLSETFEVVEPAEFEVSNLNLSGEEVAFGETFTVTVNVSNVGEKTETHIVELLVDGELADSQEVEVSGGNTETVNFVVPTGEAGTHDISISNLSQSIEVLEPAEFEVSNLEVSPKKVKSGEKVTISVEATNPNKAKTSQEIQLRVNSSGLHDMLRDLSREENRGTLREGTTKVDSRPNILSDNHYSLSFKDSYVEVPNDSSLNFDKEDFSYFLRFKAKELAQETPNQLLCKRSGGGGNYELQCSNKKITALFDGGHDSLNVIKSTFPKNSEWVNVLVVRKDGTAYLYVNGELENSRTADCNVNSDTPLVLGRDPHKPGGTFEYYNGLITDVRIYDRALSSKEAENLDKGRPVNSKGLVGHWPILPIENRFEIESAKEVTLAGGETKKVTFSTMPKETGTYISKIKDLEGSYEVQPPQLEVSNFKVENLSANPDWVESGQTVTISADVINTSSIKGTAELVLEVDGATYDPKNITIAPGKSKSVEWPFSTEVRGRYTATLEESNAYFEVLGVWRVGPINLSMDESGTLEATVQNVSDYDSVILYKVESSKGFSTTWQRVRLNPGETQTITYTYAEGDGLYGEFRMGLKEGTGGAFDVSTYAWEEDPNFP